MCSSFSRSCTVNAGFELPNYYDAVYELSSDKGGGKANKSFVPQPGLFSEVERNRARTAHVPANHLGPFQRRLDIIYAQKWAVPLNAIDVYI